MTVSARYRLAVLSRIVAAVLGGYVFATSVAILLSRAIPLPRAESALTGQLLGFVLYACAVVWAFAAKRAQWAWGGLLIVSLACGAVAWLIGMPAP